MTNTESRQAYENEAQRAENEAARAVSPQHRTEALRRAETIREDAQRWFEGDQ
jgi:hypothetical protein